MLIPNEQKENVIIYHIENNDENKTVKEILRKKLNFSSRLLSKLKQTESVYLNGIYAKYHETVKSGDEIKIIMWEEGNHFTPQKIPLEVAYEDVDLLVINKQPGIVTHPTKSHPEYTIANGAAWYLMEKKSKCKVRFVNRLDMDTSGLLIIAKNPYTHHVLSQQMQEGLIEKKYVTFVWGIVEKDFDRIEAPIYRPTWDSIKRIVDERGQLSITEYRVLERYKEATMLEVKLLTGRTHQIRVHMEHIGHPMIGDTLYGRTDETLIKRQALHARNLTFIQPRYRNKIEIKATLPQDLEDLKKKLEG